MNRFIYSFIIYLLIYFFVYLFVAPQGVSALASLLQEDVAALSVVDLANTKMGTPARSGKYLEQLRTL